MKVTIKRIIRKAGKTTRFLIYVDGKYASFKAPSGKYDSLGEMDISEDIDYDINDKWLKIFDNWRNTKRKVLSHLSEYKQNELHITEDGYWTNKDGENIEYSHILPDSDELKNLISSTYYDSMKKNYNSKKDKIHPGFKNLNSSQAFTFNFFQPIIDENLYYELLELSTDKNFIIERNQKYNYHYEKESAEDKTQFDFYIENESVNVSFEVKYTEDGFGTADYGSHKEKWESIYSKKIDRLLGSNKLSPEEFFVNYQVWRNILFTLDINHYSCFLYPKFRENDLTPIIKSILDKYPKLKGRVIVLYVDEFINKILGGNYPEKVKSHYREFKKKYLDIE